MKDAMCGGHAPVTGCPRRAMTAPNTGDELPPGPVTATVDVGPGYLPGSPAPVTVDDDLITVMPTAGNVGSGAPPAATALRPHRRAMTPRPRP